jgi:hypothetical protein
VVVVVSAGVFAMSTRKKRREASGDMMSFLGVFMGGCRRCPQGCEDDGVGGVVEGGDRSALSWSGFVIRVRGRSMLRRPRLMLYGGC